jgi:hypothetical protein
MIIRCLEDARLDTPLRSACTQRLAPDGPCTID